ncbi:probable ATP-dependent RNA helicase DDX17 [Caerostris extrusa]|uniref:Probable ATP-dependent RNA helicase DDX17 n=1 Tax=Caerostris extrusa TaxID=172846 RepID=A0AAV4MU99_CAEEX|nr:probable ATP-dependent RNA helicase DDX17 [Caerostris extrusa]
MRRDGWPAMCIHGDKSQPERDWVLNEFRTSRSPILVATDVAARGLDVDDIKFVINYDYPNCSEDYVHRIGRTARSNKSGTAYTFFTTSNAKQANDLISVLQEANQAINPRLYDIADMGRGGPGRMRNRGRSGFHGRNDSHGGRREDSRGGRSQGRDNFGRDRMRNDDRGRGSSRPDRNASSDRGSYNRENQGSSYGREAPNSNYGREAPNSSYGREAPNSSYGREAPSTSYGREAPNSNYGREAPNANYGRSGPTPAFNRDGYNNNRENPPANKNGLLNTPPANGMYQQERPPQESRYNLRAPPPTSAPRPEGNPHPYMNGQARSAAPMNDDRHGNRGNHQVASARHEPPQHYQGHTMAVNGSARPAQTMTNAQMQSLFQPPPPPPPIPNGSANKGSLMGPPPPINKYY